MAEGVVEPLYAALQPTAVVLVYLACVGAIHEIGALPFAFYRSFLLEHRYGLSTERFGHWARDHAKGAGVGGLLSCAGFSVLYAAIRLGPDGWWVVATAGFGLVAVALTGLAPVLLLPLFFTFRPLARPELSARLMDLSRRAGVAVTDVCEWQISDRTKKANAALAGIGRTRRILLSDTLLAGHADGEVEVIVAHELGHQVHHDVWKGIAIQVFVAGLGFFAASRALRMLASRLGLEGPADVAGLPVLVLCVGVAVLALLPVTTAASRAMERAADRFAIELTGDAPAFVAAVERLGAQNLADERPSRLARWLFCTHPPVTERVEAARAWQNGGRL
jgi:STE24 endopeptidase